MALLDALRLCFAPNSPLGSDAVLSRNPLIRRGGPTRKDGRQYCGLLWIRRLKVRILPPQPRILHTSLVARILRAETGIADWRGGHDSDAFRQALPARALCDVGPGGGRRARGRRVGPRPG